MVRSPELLIKPKQGEYLTTFNYLKEGKKREWNDANKSETKK